MTTFVLGSGKTGFVVGFSDRNGLPTPFFAFADISKVTSELGGKVVVELLQHGATIQRVIDAFDKHGMVVFFENYGEAEDFALFITKLLDVSVNTPWFNADANSGVMQ